MPFWAPAASPAVIISPRLSMRALTMSDADQLQALVDDRTFSMDPDMVQPFDAREWIDRSTNMNVAVLAHLISVGEKPVGALQVVLLKGRWAYLSLGFWLGAEHWGNGYATEAVKSALLYLSSVKAPKPFATVHRDNLRSIRVLEKSGFGPCDAPTESARPEMLWFRP